MTRYVLEGEWTGYSSAQRRVVHREVITAPKRVERLKTLGAIRYTDGTSLILHMRQLAPREKVKPISGYSALIREAEGMTGSIVLVADMKRSPVA